MSNPGGQSGPGGAAGRYNRSGNGLIGAMLITVVAVVGFVAFRDVFSSDVPPPDREAVDYLSSVAQLQDGGVPVVYPASLPDGWRVTSVDIQPVERPGAQPGLTLDLLTGDGAYAGMTLADEDVDALLEEYVDDDPDEAEPLTGRAGVVPEWDGWTDSGGDSAFSAPYDGRSLLVFGSASAGELADLVGRLTDAPVSATGADPSAPATATPAG